MITTRHHARGHIPKSLSPTFPSPHRCFPRVGGVEVLFPGDSPLLSAGDGTPPAADTPPGTRAPTTTAGAVSLLDAGRVCSDASVREQRQTFVSSNRAWRSLRVFGR